MLKNTHVFISWWGERRVRISGYEESVNIDELAVKFLRSSPFTSAASLQGRLTADILWERIKCLYEESDACLEQMPLYRWIVGLKEIGLSRETNPQTIIRKAWDDSYRGLLFEFTLEEFTRYFPHQQPSRICLDRHFATKSMLLKAVHHEYVITNPPTP